MEGIVTMEGVNSLVFGVWFLIGTALVFWMQAGFAMVESGFTRAKNVANIIMKNLMDFCIGTVMFILIGFSFLLGEDVIGLIGKPGFDIFTAYENFNWSQFVFNLVFCATTATIISGAMAERTKFLSYCIVSAVMSALIYPIEAHWIWGGGWLSRFGFHDFAGSCAIHMVGGISALVAAKMLGPRIGKFTRQADGSIKVRAFPGHNLPIGALGVFILWLGWYGFNGAAATSVEQLGSIFLTTTVAPAVAAIVCMAFTWIKYGKPDVTMCLNAALGGLVAITAGCDATNCVGAIVIGAVSGVLVVFGVWFLDYVLRIDDPVGAVAVHCLNGIWGTIAVGLFATPNVPGYAIVDASGNVMKGLFYGGGVKLLGIQLLGFASVAAWTFLTITLTLFIIKKTIGLRVTPEEEILGLDKLEHGIDSGYSGFMTQYTTEDVAEAHKVGIEISAPITQAVPVTKVSVGHENAEFNKIVIVTRLTKFEALKSALNSIGITGMTVVNVMGCGMQKGANEYYRGVPLEINLVPKIKVEIVVTKVPVREVIETAKKVLYTGHIGDGKIFVYGVDNVVKIRTGEEGFNALQDED